MPDVSPTQALQVACPTCGRRAAFATSNRWRPFCSERCRSIDLGAWASEAFRVPAGREPSDPDDTLSVEPRPPGG